MSNLRWSENQLEVHLNRHKLRKDFSTAQFKTKNDAKVQTHSKTQHKRLQRKIQHIKKKQFWIAK